MAPYPPAGISPRKGPNLPDTLSATYITDDSHALPVVLNDRWRVVDDPLQWVLQYRRRNMVLSDGSENPKAWQGKHYCRTRDALLRCVREYAGDVDPVALAVIDTWPDWHV